MIPGGGRRHRRHRHRCRLHNRHCRRRRRRCHHRIRRHRHIRHHRIRLHRCFHCSCKKDGFKRKPLWFASFFFGQPRPESQMEF